MESRFGGKAHHFYGPVISDFEAVGRRTMEWDLNNWRWDGDLFTATPLSLPLDCRSRQFFPVRQEIPACSELSNGVSIGLDLGTERGKRELEKRRRDGVGDNGMLNDEAGSLNLKLGGQVSAMAKWEDKSGKKTKVSGVSANCPVCQVEDCQLDLSNAKDYHRRHKVCDVHSKATTAMVANVMQRFCQQCSRFHVLQEFDEGKRSCRRRLAGHNKRRRKTHPEKVSETVKNEEQGANCLLISLLRILTNMHSNSSDQTKDQDLLSPLLRNLASLVGNMKDANLTGLLNGSQDLQMTGMSNGSPSEVSPVPSGYHINVPSLVAPEVRIHTDNSSCGVGQNPSLQCSVVSYTNGSNSANAKARDATLGRSRLNNIDLNSVYDDSGECMENQQHIDSPENLGNESPGYLLWGYQDTQNSSPPQGSGNSASTSSLSPSDSSGEAQCRTDRIVFKLFGKDPSNFPLILREQIFNWLSHSPTDIESYIRPGCIILTMYLRMDETTWDELCNDLGSSLKRFLDGSTDPFWRTGWFYTRVRHHIAFVYNGQVVLDATLPFNRDKTCMIASVKPIAVSSFEEVHFSVNGFSLSQSRLLCALEGMYLVQENCADMGGGDDRLYENNEIQSLSFSCIIPKVTGRGFIEVEDHGLSSSFFPFIVAEKDICSEIRNLESVIDASETCGGTSGETEKAESRNQALDFIHEMGWLLHRSCMKFRLGQGSPSGSFPFKRFQWLVEFSIDHDWCAVVKKLLGILSNGIVDVGHHSSIESALLEIGLLRRAVRRNCASMVQFLVGYHLDGYLDDSASEHKQRDDKVHYLFRPDATGPGGLTPLHIVASRNGCEDMLDALTDDPESAGIEAWRNSRDNAGLTPNDYACLRGHYSYIHLVQKKINKRSGVGHVILNIPGTLLENNMKHKPADGQKPVKVASFQMEKAFAPPEQGNCRRCMQKLPYGNTRKPLAIYRPAMLAMVAIATICVCVALLFKSSPEVLYVFQPFRWEMLKYGSS